MDINMLVLLSCFTVVFLFWASVVTFSLIKLRKHASMMERLFQDHHYKIRFLECNMKVLFPDPDENFGEDSEYGQ